MLGVKYADGVLLACDTLAAYGSTKRYKSFQRLYAVNDRVVVGAGGEMSDFQHIQTLLDELTTGARARGRPPGPPDRARRRRPAPERPALGSPVAAAPAPGRARPPFARAAARLISAPTLLQP